MTVKKGTTARNAQCDALTALLNAGTLEIRTGAPPTNPGDADSGTLLGTRNFNATAFGAAATGVATANAFTGSAAVASGTAGHFRAKGSGGTVILQGTLTATGGGGDATLDTVTIVAGGAFSVTSFTYTVNA